MERFHQTGLKIMKNGWQNLIGIIFIFPVYFLYFLRERVTFIRICGKEKLIGLSILRLKYLIYKRSIYKLIVADDFANKVEIESVKLFCQLAVLPKNLYTLGNDESLSRVSLIEDLYQPKLEVNIKRIYDSLKKSEEEQNNILIVGSNASALEATFNIWIFLEWTI
jgi:hypothetical protein